MGYLLRYCLGNVDHGHEMKRILLIASILFFVLFGIAEAAPHAPKIEPLIDFSKVFDDLKTQAFEVVRENISLLTSVFVAYILMGLAQSYLEGKAETRERERKEKEEIEKAVQKRVRNELVKEDADRRLAEIRRKREETEYLAREQMTIDNPLGDGQVERVDANYIPGKNIERYTVWGPDETDETGNDDETGRMKPLGEFDYTSMNEAIDDAIATESTKEEKDDYWTEKEDLDLSVDDETDETSFVVSDVKESRYDYSDEQSDFVGFDYVQKRKRRKPKFERGMESDDGEGF